MSNNLPKPIKKVEGGGIRIMFETALTTAMCGVSEVKI